MHYLPPEIGRLTNLRRLDCWSNGHLQVLPQEMENLIHLEELNLRDNGFKAIPEVIGRLVNLKWLNLDNTPIRRALNLYGNEIRELPHFLTNLPHLSSLSILHNPIEILPDAVYRHIEDAPLFFSNLIHLLRGCFIGQDAGININMANLRQLPFQLWVQNQLDAGLKGFFNALDRTLGEKLSLSLRVIFTVPLMLIRWVLLDILVPIVGLFRDLFGYERQVTVEPPPEV